MHVTQARVWIGLQGGRGRLIIGKIVRNRAVTCFQFDKSRNDAINESNIHKPTHFEPKTLAQAAVQKAIGAVIDTAFEFLPITEVVSE